MLSGRTFQREGATYLKARWPYRFVLESLGPGTSRRITPQVSLQLSANGQFFVGAQMAVSLLQTSQIISGVSFITAHVACASTNRTKTV